MRKAALTSDGDQAGIGGDDSVTYWILSCQVGIRDLERKELGQGDLAEGEKGPRPHLDVLPDIRFWVDHAHVGLISTAVDEHAIVELEEPVLGVILMD